MYRYSISSGIVPQLVNQYNDLIEQNLCKAIDLNDSDCDNHNQSIESIESNDESNEDSIVLSADINDNNNYDNCVHNTYSDLNDTALAEDQCQRQSHNHLNRNVAEEEDNGRQDKKTNESLVKNSEKVSEINCNEKIEKKQNISEDSVEQNECKLKHNINSNKSEVNDRKEEKPELIAIKVNPILEHLMNRRKHNFLTKTIVSKLICGICDQIIEFGQKYIQCVDCMAISHVSCASKVPVPCIRYTNPSLRPTKVISNYVYPAFKPSVPALLVQCVREVEERSHEGSPNSLYIMKSEALRQVKDLCNEIIKSKNGFPLLKNFNINIICGVIKKFLSDFNEPLIGREMWKQFSYNMKKKSYEELNAMIRQSIMDLNATNRDTLSFLILHLKHLADNQKHICLDYLIQEFCPIVCGDTEVQRKLNLMSFLLEMDKNFYKKILIN